MKTTVTDLITKYYGLFIVIYFMVCYFGDYVGVKITDRSIFSLIFFCWISLSIQKSKINIGDLNVHAKGPLNIHYTDKKEDK